MEPAAEREFARMMANALNEMNGRRISETSDLEALGVMAVRMLFCTGALQGPTLVEKALDEVAQDPQMPQSVARRDLERLFLRDDFAEAGISFHMVM
jgi:hypothetical protein